MRINTAVLLALVSTVAFSGNLTSATDVLGAGPFLGRPAAAAGGVINAIANAGASSGLAGNEANIMGNSMRLAQGFAGGMTSAMNAGMSDIGRNMGLGEGLAGSAASSAAAPFAGGPFGPGAFGGLNPILRNPFKRSMAAASTAAAATAAGTAPLTGGELVRAATAYPMDADSALAATTVAASSAGAALNSEETAALSAVAAPAAASSAAIEAAAAVAAEPAAAAVGNALETANLIAASNSASAVELAAASSPAAGRQALALDAMRNAQTESALAGSEMAAHGLNNARSAAMASNAYRQAKLASARDRVNIAGTIQNSARISDAAIATHDAATKAEDSLLGSELAVDSAATVLDSDGAYIPPVTSSLLRSLPYGRLGIRNIIPKPLTHPSPGLPDVWLNGYPVSYGNVPLRSLAFPFSYYPAGGFAYSPIVTAAINHGGAFFNQPFTSNNGLVLNGMVFDPAYAYLTTNLNGVVGTSVLPILANGQLEAQDELAMANLLQMQQLNGLGMSTTYQGYGRLNPVPMITGSVTDANLMPTTTIGTTYPIGSTLVIEPRDSFFQDYNDNASSRQNFDERQQ